MLTRLGRPIAPGKAPCPLTHIVTSDLPCPRSGVILRADFLEAIDSPRVILKRVYVTAGQRVTGPDGGVPDSLGEIFVAAASTGEAACILDELLAQIQFDIAVA